MERSAHSLENFRNLTIASNSLGLRLISRPSTNPSVDIIFVHGLDGHPTRTWSRNHDPHLFWPSKWLPLHQEIAEARIFTYGYNATLDLSPSSGACLGIQKDAKDLLSHMRAGVDPKGRPFEMGNVPIIFIAFELGGLVVKKAHILGLFDDEYFGMIRRVSGYLFLATPHRGPNLADSLTRILNAKGMLAPKHIADMSLDAMIIERINDQFRFDAGNLILWSFYEVSKVQSEYSRPPMLKQKTSTLGYPEEVSTALKGTHHNLCSFTSRDDDNYSKVLLGLETMIRNSSRVPRFVYQPLSFEKIEIRLVSIDPAHGTSSKISCRLEQVPLFQAPSYVALSYCWGDSETKVPILLNQQAFNVTPNLHAALNRLRSDNVDFIWVDALCINQFDKEERSIQIGRMTAIYKQAKEVIIWLGDDKDLLETDFSLLNELSSDSAPSTHVFISDTLLAATSRLLAREYWGRVWIIQELAAAEAITVLCGVYTIPWQSICQILPDQQKSRAECYDQLGPDHPMTVYHELHTTFRKIHRFREDKLTRTPIAMTDALYRSRHALSTDPKDKLYALLGLVYDGPNFIPHPNYSLTKEEVYRDFSIELVKNGYPLDFLFLRSASRDVYGNLPSWVVDWTNLHDLVAQEQFKDVVSIPMPLSAGKGDRQVLNRDILVVRGIVIGSLQTARISSEDGINSVVGDAKEEATLRPSMPFVEIELTPNISKAIRGNLVRISENEDQLHRFATSALHMPARTHHSDTTSGARVPEDLRQRLQMRTWISENKISLGLIGIPKEQHAFWSRNHEYLTTYMDLLIYKATTGMLFVLLEGAILGCVHPQSKAGDVVALIHGCNYAVVLRPTSHGHRIVGWAFGITDESSLLKDLDGEVQLFIH